MDSTLSPTTRPLYRGTQIVWYLLGAIEIVLAFRFLLRLMGANPDAGFTNLVYTISYPFAAPFLAVFRQQQVPGTGSVLEWTTLLAMLVYWIVAWGIVQLLVVGRDVSTPEAARHLERQNRLD